MKTSSTSILSRSLQLGLEDLVADLTHARRQEDLGRLALLCYCDVRHWARQAGEAQLAEAASRLFAQPTAKCRQDFLDAVDELLVGLRHLTQAIGAGAGDALPANPGRQRSGA